MAAAPRHDDGGQRPPRRGRLTPLLLCLLALGLGPLAAIAAAGDAQGGPPSGGGGLITTSTTGGSLTIGTTTLIASTTTTSAAGTTTTTCNEPAVGTVTTAGSGSGQSGAGSTTGGAGSSPPGSTTGGAGSSPPGSTTSGDCTVPPPAPIPAPPGNPFTRRGMWIWELPATDGGSLSAVIAQAHRYGIGTIYLKSGDGTAVWSQFNPNLVNALHAAHLHVCAWQYVYGNEPVLEAEVGAAAVRDGADCLVIDAESEYQGKYVQAQKYVRALRARIGARFPVALAGLAYVDYHPTFPYSVFLGPGGAQYNLPQMYWQDIGTSVDAVYAHTFTFNELYQRPIYPLGQLFSAPPTAAVRRFRSVGFAYRVTGLSWWDWQSAGLRQFDAISTRTGPIRDFHADRTVASLGRGAIGDLVVLAQEHLWNTPERVTIDGGFGPETEQAVAAFQAQAGLPVSGIVTPQTWLDLLKVPLPQITWVVRHGAVVAEVRG
ncbi:peptidoglycan-binding protein [Conexibacter sp. DBS9H8]|uniref:peptidoglycan-binding domain-containing protein n=1 Tax=Conexibacter sp. DBS9H8 TaxID=2937801 RepID=UPI00200D5D4A|nr:peptidoglycan-binding protein [Conexibacter sp. DBS9H8]